MSASWKFWEKKKVSAPVPGQPPDNQTLADIVRGMQHAVNTAQGILQQHWRDTLDPYFDDETGKPITEKYLLPSGQLIEMPLIALVSPAGLVLDHMEIEMAVRIDASEVKPHRSASQEETAHHRTSLKCSFAPIKKGEDRSMNSVLVKMVFKAGDAPEGVARLIEEFTNSVVSKKSGPESSGTPDAPEAPEAPDAPAPTEIK
jgi:hypothetical protein